MDGLIGKACPELGDGELLHVPMKRWLRGGRGWRRRGDKLNAGDAQRAGGAALGGGVTALQEDGGDIGEGDADGGGVHVEPIDAGDFFPVGGERDRVKIELGGKSARLGSRGGEDT